MTQHHEDHHAEYELRIKGPVGNVKVRKAIAAAIDKNVIVDQLFMDMDGS
ncbi:MAG: hypothetical protein ACLUEQ_08270 [Cloacibacillus evryensis]